MSYQITFKIGQVRGEVLLNGTESDMEDVVYLYRSFFKAKDLLVNYPVAGTNVKNVKQALNYAHGVSVAAGYSGVFG